MKRRDLGRHVRSRGLRCGVRVRPDRRGAEEAGFGKTVSPPASVGLVRLREEVQEEGLSNER